MTLKLVFISSFKRLRRDNVNFIGDERRGTQRDIEMSVSNVSSIKTPMLRSPGAPR